MYGAGRSIPFLVKLQKKSPAEVEDIFLYKAKFPKYTAPEIDIEVHSKLKGDRKRTPGPMFFNYNIKNLKNLSVCDIIQNRR